MPATYERGKCTMLDLYMKSDEYFNMIEKAVDNTDVFKAISNEFKDALDKLNLDLKTCDTIDNPAIMMTCEARELGYKKGFQDGVKLTVDCVSSGRSPKATVDFNSMMENKDFRKAWDLKLEAHNKLMDLLAASGVNLDTVKVNVEELERTAVDFGITMTKLQAGGI